MTTTETGDTNMTPCTQQDKIESISATLERMERGQERLIDLLEVVARQDGRLNNVEEKAERVYNEVHSINERLRDVELNQAAYGPEARLQFNNIVEEITRNMTEFNIRIEKVLKFHRLVTSRRALYIYGIVIAMILFGMFLDYKSHPEMFSIVWKLLGFAL